MKQETTSAKTRLARPVEVVVKTKAQCRDDPDLEAFSVEDGPAAEECESIRARLCSGDAVEQTVAMLKEEGSSRVLSLISIWFDGRPEWAVPFWPGPAWLRKLARTTPYIGLLARDTHCEGCILADGETYLGAATVRAGLELAMTPGGIAPLALWATVNEANNRAHRVFRTAGFHVHPRSAEVEGEIIVRRSGHRLRPAPPLTAYRPLLQLPGHEHPLAG